MLLYKIINLKVKHLPYLTNSRHLVDKKLFTPGPLLTTLTVKKAQLQDLGSRDSEFIELVQVIQKKILELAGFKNDEKFVSVLVQGSGTFGVESIIQTVNSHNKSNFLVLENGAYGQRMSNICKRLKIPVQTENFAEDAELNIHSIEKILQTKRKFTHVSVVHSETTSGVLNNVDKIGKLVKKYLPDACYIVDSISAFGAIPLSMVDGNIDFLVGSSNKCIQSVPGFAFVVCNKEKLLSCKGNSMSLSLDLYDQYTNMKNTKQFRFTPPVQSLLAFRQALKELEEEGGSSKRYERYCLNHKILRDGLLKIGFKELVPYDQQSKIISSFYYPKDKKFNFEEFYNRLSQIGKIIYPGKITKALVFRIGNIGDLHPQDMLDLIESIKIVLKNMNIKVPIEE